MKALSLPACACSVALSAAIFVCCATVLAADKAENPATDAVGKADEAFFASRVRTMLVVRCLECQGDKKQEGGLRLDSRSGWEKGGDSGTALVPGKPEVSLLIKAVSYVEKDLQMPPTRQLPAGEVALLKEWVKKGA